MPTPTTTAVIITAPGQSELRDFPTRGLQPNEVRVANTVSAVSFGTERAVTTGRLHGTTLPCLLGYQAVGRIVEVGSKVVAYRIGDRVCAGSSSFQPEGYGQGAGNAHQSHPIVPDKGDWAQRELVRIPEAVSDEEASYAWLMSVSLQGVERAHVQMKDVVAVVGLGLVGQFAAQAARAAGATVYACDLSADRVEKARRLSADVAIVGDVAALNAAVRADHPAGASVVIECTGNTQVLDAALDLAAREGRVVLQGHYHGDVKFRFIAAHPQRLTLFCPCAWMDLRPVLELVRRRKLAVKPWLGDVFTPDQAPELYRRVHRGDPELFAALIRWS
jgi:2-desacetyl-2-hydroxyethyl bacteriochlorophyllide A dehydrogenase